MAMENSSMILMEPITLVSLKWAISMDKVLRFMNVVQSTQVHLTTDFSMVRLSIHTKMVTDMKATSSKVLETGKELVFTCQATFTLVNGKKTRKMVKVHTTSHREINMKEIGKLAENMDSALIPTPMEFYLKDFMKMTKDMVLEEFTIKIMS